MPSLVSIPVAALSPQDRFDFGVLNWRTWPSQDHDERARAAMTGAQGPELRRDEVVHLLRDDDGKLVAEALSFLRTVTVGGRSLTVLGLAAVCVDAGRRGGGHGRAVVEAAFARLGDQVAVALFQTAVPDFYLRLGSRAIANPIVNSSGDRRAFWDPHAMIHPATFSWPEGEVDLLGPGW